MPPRKRIAARFGPPGGSKVVIDDPEALKVLYDPLRFKIIGLLGEARTAKEIADEIDRPLTSLYYHLNVLVEHGLVRVEEERVRGRSVERVFRRAADEFAADAELASVVGGILDRRGGLASAVEHLRRAFQPTEDEPHPHRPGTRMVMDMCFTSSADEAQRVMEHIRDAVDQHVQGLDDGDGSQRRFRLVIAISETDDEDDLAATPPKKRRRAPGPARR